MNKRAWKDCCSENRGRNSLRYVILGLRGPGFYSCLWRKKQCPHIFREGKFSEKFLLLTEPWSAAEWLGQEDRVIWRAYFQWISSWMIEGIYLIYLKLLATTEMQTFWIVYFTYWWFFWTRCLKFLFQWHFSHFSSDCLV